MIRLLRKLPALPFIWLGNLAVLLRQAGPAIPVLRLAWRISGDGRIGLTALVQVYSVYGREASAAEARQWMRAQPRTEVVAWAGILAMEDNRLDEARAMLERAQRLGRDRWGILDMLEGRVLAAEGGEQRYRQFCLDMEARRDATPEVSKAVLTFLAMDALVQGRFDEARRRARLLLEVEESATARVVLWALARRAGREAEAAGHLRRAPGRDTLVILRQRIVAARAIGDDEQVRQCLAAIGEADPEQAGMIRRQLADAGEGRE